MRVLVTGGTGFVGAHTVSALVEHGHAIRLLIRAPERIAPALRPLGLDAVLLHRYDTRCDDSRARKEFGPQPRPLVDTYRDAARWLYEAGWLNARQAGVVRNLQTADE